MAENVTLPALRSFYDNRMGLVTLEDDVLSVVSQVRELTDGRVRVELDPVTGWYHLVEYCEDTTQRLVFSVEELDARVVERLQRADSQNRYHEDPYDAAEREQDEAQRRIDEAYREKIREHGEELIHAVQKAGQAPRLPLKVYIPRGVDA